MWAPHNTWTNITGLEELGIFPVMPLVFGKIGDRSVGLRTYERTFFEEPYAESVASSCQVHRSPSLPSECALPDAHKKRLATQWITSLLVAGAGFEPATFGL